MVTYPIKLLKQANVFFFLTDDVSQETGDNE